MFNFSMFGFMEKIKGGIFLKGRKSAHKNGNDANTDFFSSQNLTQNFL